MWLPIPGPPLDSIKAADARLNLWHGPVRSSKTVSSLLAWTLFVDQAPPGDLFMTGKTAGSLARNALRPIQAFLGESNFEFSLGKGEAWMRAPTSGKRRLIYLVGANDERATDRIQGATAAGFYGDEVTLWPESFFKMMLSRLSVRGSRFYGTTNPAGPYHWLKRDYIDRADELNIRAFHWAIEANTMLAPEYIAELKREYREGTLWYKRFILGLWVAAAGAVYDFFDETEHVLIAPPPRDPDELFLSVDYGTSNATSAGLYGVYRQPLDGVRAVRLKGYYHSGRDTGRQKTDAQYATDLDETFADAKPLIKRVIVDPSAASFAAELRQHGWKTMHAKNDVLDGIRTQAKMLQKGEYKLVKNTSNGQAIRDYGAYLWDTKAQERGEDKPLQQNDHTKDEERYVLHTIFGKGTSTPDAVRRLNTY